eukprot:scaffold11275_cov108-Isochrysis_galbana.AAC.7
MSRTGATGVSLTVMVMDENEAGRPFRRTVVVPGDSPRRPLLPTTMATSLPATKLTSGVTSKPSTIAFNVVI